MGPSELEVKNAVRILDMLSEIDDITYKKLREDIFEVTNITTGVTCVVDVEETIVCIFAEVCDLPTETGNLFVDLLKANAEAVHGKFQIKDEKIFFQDNLEIENLDRNEFEASLGWLFASVNKNLELIAQLA